MVLSLNARELGHEITDIRRSARQSHKSDRARKKWRTDNLLNNSSIVLNDDNGFIYEYSDGEYVLKTFAEYKAQLEFDIQHVQASCLNYGFDDKIVDGSGNILEPIAYAKSLVNYHMRYIS